MIKAIFFDMNGIIIDDEHIHKLAFKETVNSFGIDLTHEDYLECCAGKTDKAGYESIGQKFKKNLPIKLLLKEKSQRYLDLFPANKKDYPGVIDLITRLSNDYRVALTSSSSRAEVELIIQEFKIKKYFEVLITGDDVIKGKPDPEPYLKTARQMNLLPQECVVIEDSRSGVMSAKTAGCKCIGVTTTHSSKDLAQADVTAKDFESITSELINSL